MDARGRGHRHLELHRPVSVCLSVRCQAISTSRCGFPALRTSTVEQGWPHDPRDARGGFSPCRHDDDRGSHCVLPASYDDCGIDSLDHSITGLAIPYWVRLVRQGDVFTGYRSQDGVTWSQVDSSTMTLPSSVYVGLAVTSHNPSQLATASIHEPLDEGTAVAARRRVLFLPRGSTAISVVPRRPARRRRRAALSPWREPEPTSTELPISSSLSISLFKETSR